eukprot:CAMPEP_0113618424 /NCGR_PEP_ID=MMETSP0017_2-20120614/9325_1 /TAXON_ID=2856 /ORGANISM="Cylindrotheca closterium" /LENGTH=358 /DNA_ID=CAMNT_0000527923 /DNA_START=75 /DNA_END=1151 /DNA_ORIENTATION=+ /assembly_acc=CAM_ASM_000147
MNFFSPQKEVLLSVIAYSLCSGSLVLINKLTLHYLPFPSLVIAFQLAACITLVYGAKLLGYIDVDPFNWQYVKPYLLYTGFFCFGVYCNMRSLASSNVETVIVFRALAPVMVAFLDAIFLGREWPSQRSWAGLSTLVLGAYLYANEDEKFQTQGYSAYGWPALYTIVIALEMAYGKSIVKSVPLKTRSGPVIYTNVLGFMPMLVFAMAGKEYGKLWDFWWTGSEQRLPPVSVVLLIIGALVGTLIGYSSWWCRSVVSATSFTLIGVVNKCLTILMNVMIWDQHATPGGIFALFICISGGMIYKQAPMRGASSTKTAAGEDNKTDDDETLDLIEKEQTGEESTIVEKEKGDGAAQRRLG